MRLFKYAAVIAVATAGRKFETNEEERDCMSVCKHRLVCHGQDNTDGPTECIQTCRDECTSGRKKAIKNHLQPRTQQKAVVRKATAKMKRLEQRKEAKKANPHPMIKDFHQAYEDGDVPRRFVACLKHEREKEECEGHGPEMWGCKRSMVSNCLDRNGDFEKMGSEKLVQLVQEFRNGLAEMARAQMQNDVQPTEAPTENPLNIMGVAPNRKDKVKVNNLSKALAERKRGKKNYLANQTFESTPAEPAEETAEEREYEDEPEYEAEPEEEEEEPEYEAEPEEGESEDAELESTMQNDWSMLNQIVDFEEPVEAENKPLHREAVKKPMALYSYVGNGGSRQVMGGRNNKAQLSTQNSKDNKLPHVKRLSKDQFINEMCRCRTSMEHYRVKNYLARNHVGKYPSLSSWEHHDETCKWCAFPNSKKCWQCQVHWKKASEHATDNDMRVRNEQTEMACYLYVRSVKNGKFLPMNTKDNDPCPMRNLHHGNYNAWQAAGKYGKQFDTYKEMHHQHHKNGHKGHESHG